MLDLEPTALLAVAVRGQLPFQQRCVVGVQAVEGLGREELVDQRVVADHRVPSPRFARSRRIASSVRDFTVPSGSPVRSAI